MRGKTLSELSGVSKKSLKGSEDAQDTAKLRDEVNLLKDRVEYWKSQIRRTVQVTTDKKAVTKAARELIHTYGADLTVDDIASDFTRDLLRDVGLFDELARQDRSVAGKLLDAVRYFIDKVKELFKGDQAGQDRAALNAWGVDMDALEEAARLWQKAYDAAVEQAQTAQKNTAQEGGEVRYSIKRTGKMTLAEQLKAFYDGKLHSSDALYFGETPALLDAVGLDRIPLAFTIANFKKSTQKKHNVPRRVLKNLNTDLETALFAFSDGDRVGIITSDIDGDGKPLLVGIQKDVKMDNFKVNAIRSVYGLDNPAAWLKNQIESGKSFAVLDEKRANTFLYPYGYSASRKEGIRSLGDSVSQGDKNGNTKFSLKTDSQRRKLTEGQREFFKDSQVVDDQGRLIPVDGFYLNLDHKPENLELTKRQKDALYLGQRFAELYGNEETISAWERFWEEEPDLAEKAAYLGTEEKRFLKAGVRGDVPEYRLALRYGAVPEGGRSMNWGTGESERGVSVIDFLNSETQYGGTIYDTLYGMQGTQKYIVGGWNFDIFGSDGEPLLITPEVIAPIEEINRIKRIDNQNPTSDPDIRHSLKDAADLERDAVALAKENRRLREQLEYWKGQIRRTVQVTTDKKAVTKAARELIHTYGADLTVDDIASDFTRDLLRDVGLFDELARQDRSVAGKLLDAVKEFISKVKALFDRSGQNRAAIDAFGMNMKELKEAVRLWQRTYDAATERAKTAQKNTAREGGKYSLKNNPYHGKELSQDGEIYDYDFLASLPDMNITVLPEVPVVRDASGKVNTGTAIQEGLKNARSVGTERDGKIFVRNIYTGKQLLLTTSSIRHGLNGEMNRLLTNARLGAVIGDVVKNAVPINALHNKADGVSGTYSMAAYVTDSQGREFVAIITVEQYDGNISGLEVYDVTHAVSGRQKKASPADTKSQGFFPSTAGTISISDFLKIVKGTHRSILSDDVLSRLGEKRNPGGFYTGQVKFSLKNDSVGRNLTDAQRVYFKDSQAVDGQGRLLTLFHGTRKGGFTVSRDWSYLTANEAYARRYADKETGETMYEVYANIKKPFDTRLEECRKIWESEFFGEYSRSPLQDTGLPDWTDGYDLVDFLEENGYDYDAILLGEGADPDGSASVTERGISYVVRSPEQIKSVTNQILTSDPDIRHSLKGAADLERDAVALAKELLRAYGADLTVEDISGDLQSLYDYIASGRDGKNEIFDEFDAVKAAWEQMMAKARQSRGPVGERAVGGYTGEKRPANAREAAEKYGIGEDVFVSLWTRTVNVRSLQYADKRDADGKPVAIPNSKSLLIMQEVYNTPGLTERQRQALFGYLGVGKSVRHYNKTLVREELAEMRKLAK